MEVKMLWNFFVIIFLWAVAVAGSYTLGGLVHLLLLFAVVTATVDFLRYRKRRFY
ncbi:MAG: DUF5670 family protein [Methanococcaceae archaeon]